MTILIIDDDKTICETTKVLLEDEYKVLMVFSGAEGLYALSKEIVSLVILDYKLPDMDGIEMLKNIKENYRIPVIMITGVGNKEVVLKSWRHKADYYIDKPFKIEELKEKIKELITPLSETPLLDALGINPSDISTHTRCALGFLEAKLSGRSDASEKTILKELSDMVLITPKHLSSLLKKECGKNIQEIINIIKIERAKKLLSIKGKDIKEVALELGFKHDNNFCRFFKKLTGKSPSDIRNTGHLNL